jgi:YhcN/YlaJ family sporulation lipoprotein
MIKWIAWTALLSLLLSGCGSVGRNETSPSPQNKQRIQTQQTTRQQSVPNNPQQIAEHLEALARGVHGVEDATCVIVGKQAIVGLDVDRNLDRARVGTIKYSVAEALRQDPNGVNAIVTADMDLGQRLQEIRKDIQKGRPAAGFAEEMADIIGRIVPQMPRDTNPGADNAGPAPSGASANRAGH